MDEAVGEGWGGRKAGRTKVVAVVGRVEWSGVELLGRVASAGAAGELQRQECIGLLSVHSGQRWCVDLDVWTQA